jgi:methionine sulfoxide reductase heme-binding subunit
MNIITLKFHGWKIVTYSTIVIASILALILLVHGFNEESLRIAIRNTARTSCLLFISAFIASALRHFSKHNLVQWLRKNRRYLGLSMAISHSFHALAIISLAFLTADPYLSNNHGGNLGYLFIIAMTITSFKPTANLLGSRGWLILHTVGMYYLWLAFIYTFASRLNESLTLYIPFVSLLAIALIIRLLALRTRKMPVK